MATCNECIHNEICDIHGHMNANDCRLYRDKCEAYRELAESVKQISKEVTVPYVADTSIQEHKTGMFWYRAEDFDNLLKELTENNDKE